MRLSSILPCLLLLSVVFSCNSDDNENTTITTLDDAKLAVASLDTIKSVVSKEFQKHYYLNDKIYTVDLKSSGLTGYATMTGADSVFDSAGHCVQSGNKHSTLDLNLSDYSIVESLSLNGSGTILYNKSTYNIAVCGQTPDLHYQTSSDTLEIMSQKLTVTIKQKNIHDVVEVRIKVIKSIDSRQDPENSESTLIYLKTASGLVFEW